MTEHIKEPAILYIRVSTADQAEHGVSLDAQLERLVSYSVSRGLDVVAIVREEGVSGTIPLDERPRGCVIHKMIAAGHVKHIVALKLDRLFRSTVDALNTTSAWNKSGVSLHLVDMGGQSLNTGSALGRMMLTMMAGFAQFERDLTAERTAAALAHKKMQGLAYSPTPYGKEKQDGALVDSPKELAVISEIMQLHGEGASLRTIANGLNERKVPTKNGGKWYASTVKYILDRAA